MKRFLSVEKCVKCGRGQIFELKGERSHYPQPVYIAEHLENGRVVPEYLKIKCQCGYEWDELCKDAKENEN